MSTFRFMPKGGDGSDAIEGISTEDARVMNVATDTFRSMVTAMDRDDEQAAQTAWQGMVDQVADSVNPYVLLAQVGVIFNAYVLRRIAGDPAPYDPPTGHLRVTVAGWSPRRESFVDTPLEDFAAEAIVYAANWQWDELNGLMGRKLDEVSDKDEFLHNLASVLLSMFMGVGGLDQTGWRDS